MKRSCMAIALFVVVAGCDTARSVTAPNPAVPTEPPLSGFFTLSGLIEDAEHVRLSGARVSLTTQSSIQTTVSSQSGEYRFDNVRGSVVLGVSKDGFGDEVLSLYIAQDSSQNVALQRPLTLVPGTTVRGTVKAPPCDPSWDSRALCQSVSFIPPVTGDYELVLKWAGASELDLLVDQSLSLYWSGTAGEIRVIVPGDAGRPREIRIHSYYSPTPFELSASLKPVP
jgi:carboxypeptidase family protein